MATCKKEQKEWMNRTVTYFREVQVGKGVRKNKLQSWLSVALWRKLFIEEIGWWSVLMEIKNSGGRGVTKKHGRCFLRTNPRSFPTSRSLLLFDYCCKQSQYWSIFKRFHRTMGVALIELPAPAESYLLRLNRTHIIILLLDHLLFSHFSLFLVCRFLLNYLL